MRTGNIVKSLKGHDTGRVYLVVAVLNNDFVLLSDGKYRKLDNPKQKRIKHAEVLDDATYEATTDSGVRKICKQYNK